MSFFSRWGTKKGNKKELAKKTETAKIKIAGEKEEKKEVVVEERKEQVLPKVKDMKFKEAYRILLRPVITEKSTYLQSEGVYCFQVALRANKNEIRKAVEAVFGVKVLNIRILNKKGKKVNFGRVRGERRRTKKAMVSLAKGQSIEIHKNV